MQGPGFKKEMAHIAGFLTKKRLEKMKTVLKWRTRYIVCVLENLYDPRNGSAVMRHCDAMGLQEVHVIENRNRFRTDSQVDLGTSQWLEINHLSGDASQTAKLLRQRGLRIVGTSPHDDNKTTISPEKFDLRAGPFAIIFGSEKEGLSSAMIKEADCVLKIPLFGFVESFNISASAAIIIHVLTQRLRSESIRWQISEEDAEEILFHWMKNSVSNSDKILKRFNSDYFTTKTLRT